MNAVAASHVRRFQELTLDLPQVEVEVQHHFADGCYAREMRMKEGQCVVGATHATNHHFVLSQGTCIVVTDESQYEISAPYHGQTYPGDKRIIFALTDIVWTTFHVTDEKDINKIDDAILVPEV